MGTVAKATRENCTITVDFRNEATYLQLLGDGKAFLECVMAFILALGFQLTHHVSTRRVSAGTIVPGPAHPDRWL
jgi:hypothetical protein